MCWPRQPQGSHSWYCWGWCPSTSGWQEAITKRQARTLALTTSRPSNVARASCPWSSSLVARAACPWSWVFQLSNFYSRLSSRLAARHASPVFFTVGEASGFGIHHSFASSKPSCLLTPVSCLLSARNIAGAQKVWPKWPRVSRPATHNPLPATDLRIYGCGR
jgi:hypothetical protein